MENILRIIRKVDFINYLFHCFFTKKHIIRTDLKKGYWYDTDTRLLYSMMKLLVDFVDKEEPFEVCDWTDDEEHIKAKSEIEFIYKWWKNYPNREKEIEDALNTWYESSRWKKLDGKNFNMIANTENTENEQILSDKVNELQKNLLNEETDVLIRLVEIRNFLWT